MNISSEDVRRVYDSLNHQNESWHHLSCSIVFVHMEEQLAPIWECKLQAAFNFYVLAAFACDVLRQHPDKTDRVELAQKIKRTVNILNNVAYHAMLPQRERDFLFDMAEKVEELMFNN